MTHVPAGRLNGISGEIGTLLGPKDVTRELVVITGVDEHGVTVGYARVDDRFPADPRSVTEVRELIARQNATLRLFGSPLVAREVR